MYNTTWGKEGGRGREETRLGRAVNWNGSAEGGVRAVESEMAHCESYLSCCLRIYGVRYTRIYIYTPVASLLLADYRWLLAPGIAERHM